MSAQPKTYRVALIPGDGIGREVVPQAVDVLEAAGRRFGFAFAWTELDWGCERFRRSGQMMPADGPTQLRNHDAILLGAVGLPDVPDHISLWEMLIPLRRELRQYVNLRPVRLLPGVRSPLANRRPEEIDFVIVRENNEGEYSRIGGRIYQGTDDEIVIQETVFTRRGVDRIIRYAFELARATAAPTFDFRHKIQRYLLHDALLGRAICGDQFRVPRRGHRQIPHRHFDRALCATSRSLRRRGGLEFIRRHSFRSWPRAGRLDRTCAIGEYQSRKRVPLDV